MSDMNISEREIAHLGIIQGVISRMASNSFALKALAVTIVSAIIAVIGTQADTPNSALYVGLLPVVVFWLLDAKYLRLERLYRKLYDHIRKGNQFDAFSMNTSTFEKDVPNTLKIAFTWSVIWFYLVIAIVLVAATWLPLPTISQQGI